MQKLGETMAAGCGFTIDELREAEGVFAAAGAKVRAARRSSCESSMRLPCPSPLVVRID